MVSTRVSVLWRLVCTARQLQSLLATAHSVINLFNISERHIAMRESLRVMASGICPQCNYRALRGKADAFNALVSDFLARG
jgi:hypothetical protein